MQLCERRTYIDDFFAFPLAFLSESTEAHSLVAVPSPRSVIWIWRKVARKSFRKSIIDFSHLRLLMCSSKGSGDAGRSALFITTSIYAGVRCTACNPSHLFATRLARVSSDAFSMGRGMSAARSRVAVRMLFRRLRAMMVARLLRMCSQQERLHPFPLYGSAVCL